MKKIPVKLLPLIALALSLLLASPVEAKKKTPTPVPPTQPPPPTETTTAVPTPSPTATPETAATPTPLVGETPSPWPTPATPSTPTPGDAYEDDRPPHAPVYIGPQLRSFYPTGDVDYVRYRLKANVVTYFETHDLTGEGDTIVCVYRDDDGLLTESDPLLGCDDDSGVGLSSYLALQVSADMDVTVTIVNKSLGYAPTVGYTFRIIAEPNATPTPTSNPPTATPRGQEPPTP
jgi:hypothetical protein